uniref:Galectin n=1 Tax=Salarias fasciatus TaxID=181472 RepID=A0A672I447_SALFA
ASAACGFQEKDQLVPYTETLRSGVYDRMLIVINGTIESNANMSVPTSEISRTGSQDIALHFSPRFAEKQMVVTNSCIGGKWGQEERELQRFPFVRGQAFKLEILCTSSEYKVTVNGSHLLSYKHRITDLRSITSLGIYKDVKLTSVETK